MSDAPVSTKRARHPWRWAVGAIALLLVLALSWLAWGLLSAAREARSQAGIAQSSLSRAATALADGDVAGARAAVAEGTVAVDAASAALESPQVRFVGALPIVSQAVDDARALADAAVLATGAAGDVTDAYAAAKGVDGAPPLFATGRVDEVVLQSVLTRVVSAATAVDAAEVELDKVQATLPGTAPLAEARDSARAELAGLRGGLDAVATAAPSLPAALGFDGPRTYLLAILNSAELRASGGPPLAVAVLRFDRGRLTVVARGQTGVVFMPGNPKVEYEAADGTVRFDRFVNATADADYRIAGIDLARSWEASTSIPVDGVITVDAVALAEVLNATGPIEVEGYGEVTGDNFVQTVLVDAYERFAGAQEDRQQVNTQMIDELAARLVRGDSTLPVLRALGGTSPARHVQAWFADETLNDTVADSSLAGAVADVDDGADRVAVFTQNVNGSKVDVFQQRSIAHDVALAADGSADVSQSIAIGNDTPPTRRSDRRTYYRTGWSHNVYRIYLPDAATDVSVTLPPGTEGAVRSTSTPDPKGRHFATVDAWIKPQGSLIIDVDYRLPAGTFTDAAGLTYRLLADPQALVRPATLTVRVTVPGGRSLDAEPPWQVSGDTAVWSGALTQPLRLTAVAR